MTVGGVGQDEQHMLAGLGIICDGGAGGGVEAGLGGDGVAAGRGVGVGVGSQPLGTAHITLFAYTCSLNSTK